MVEVLGETFASTKDRSRVPKMILGIPGDLVVEHQSLRYITRAGGEPTFSGPSVPVPAEELSCVNCNNNLSLVLQAYAPAADASGNYNDERFLYMFGCTSLACTQGRWVGFRCQLSSTEAATTRELGWVPHDPLPQQSVHSTDIMLQGGNSLTVKKEIQSESAFDLSELDAGLDAILNLPPCRPQSKAKSSKKTSAKKSSRTHERSKNLCFRETADCCERDNSLGEGALPSFEILAQDEPEKVACSWDLKKGELAHVQRLMAGVPGCEWQL
eukprot:jgi/Botrbrau1/10246/Bobra.0140s0003.1